MTETSRPITPALGLEVTGLSTDELVTAEGAQKAQEALDRYGVVVYREIHIGDDDLLALSRMMGTLAVQRTGEHEHPEIQTIRDPTKTNALLASFRQGNFHWHIDGATDELPQKEHCSPRAKSTSLAATPNSPAPTPPTRRCRPARRVKSTRSKWCTASPMPSRWPIPTRPPRSVLCGTESPRVHPLVWQRLSGGSRCFSARPRPKSWGGQRNGRELLDRLQDWCSQPQFTLRHKWHRGDLVMWDNTGMLHRALPFEPTSVRLMHRTTLVGEEPVAVA